MSEIKFDKNNYRIHNEKNKRIIKKSLTECGAGRSVLVDKDNVLIAGNGVYEQAQELGLKVRVIETDGTELVVVKRNDLSTDDERRKLLALADNHSSDTSVFDMALVIDDFDEQTLKEFEFPESLHVDLSDFFNNEEEEDENEEGKNIIKLEYNDDDYAFVTSELKSRSGTNESIILNLLKQ